MVKERVYQSLACPKIEYSSKIWNPQQVTQKRQIEQVQRNAARFVSNKPFEPVHEISNNVVCATSKGSDQPAHTRSLIRVFASRLSIL